MTILVLGASGTLGQSCVRLLAEEHRVIAADLRAPSIPEVRSVALDVTDVAAVREVIQRIDHEDELTGVIYAAGLNTTGYIDSIDWVDYERVMAVNLRGAFHVGAALLGILRGRPRPLGTVFISSTAGLVGESGGSIYCASKFGLIGFTQSFAGEIAPFGGRANVVCPGNIDSPMLTNLASKIGDREGRTGAEVLHQWISSSAFKRLITPDEVAHTCSWLVTNKSSGISGQTIVVDGARA